MSCDGSVGVLGIGSLAHRKEALGYYDPHK